MSEALSVGIVTGSMSRKAGGLFNSVRKSALHLAEAGADVSVYALEDEFSAADRAAWEPLAPHIFPVRFGGPLPHASGLAESLSLANHDVLHLHGIWQLQSFTVNRWKHGTDRPVMISPRGMLDPWALANSAWKKKLVGAFFENRNLREADCLHALNASEMASMCSYGLLNPVAVIPNATDLPEMNRRGEGEGKKTLLFLGRIHPKKGLGELVTAWAKATDIRPDLRENWRLCIAGWDDGGHIDSLHQQIAAQSVGDSVSVIGPAFGEEKKRLLQDADAFILPSFSEGMPMSVLEAWAYRLPVLMTAQCNLPEGFAAKAAVEITTDPKALAGKLVSTLCDPGLAMMGDAGRALVERQFSWSRIAEMHLEVYSWLVHGGTRPACVSGAEG